MWDSQLDAKENDVGSIHASASQVKINEKLRYFRFLTVMVSRDVAIVIEFQKEKSFKLQFFQR